MGLRDRLAHAWNAFFPEDQPLQRVPAYDYGPSYSTRPDRPRFRVNSERTIIASIYTRIAIDAAAVKIEHVRLDDEDQYVETIQSGLNDCLNIKANTDQAGRHLRQDLFMTLLSEGVIAIVPVDTTQDPTISGTWDVRSLRIGTVLQWYPQFVQVRVYNENKGMREDVILPKSMVAIVENPFYSVMNEPNSTLQRLVHKLNLLDNIDDVTSSGKLDIIIQLPYVVKSEQRKQQANQRRQELEDQLKGSTYGIAYADGTEKITQLNRSVENNLLEQINKLKQELYNELGMTEGIMNGTATDVEMLNYTNRTIEPLLDAAVESMIMTFLTRTARTQGQSMMYFQQPFKMIPISQLADIADTLSRNQIATPNELRLPLGLKPSKQPQANKLVNSNMPLDQQITDSGAQAPDNTTVEQVPNPPAKQPLALPAGSSAADQQEAKLDKTMAELGIK